MRNKEHVIQAVWPPKHLEGCISDVTTKKHKTVRKDLL